MNLKDTAIGNIEKIISDFADENMPQKTKRLMSSYMASVAANAFRLGYLSGNKNETTTEEEFMDMLYGKNTNREISGLLSEITFRICAY